MDAIDRKILTILQEDGRTSNAELADRVGLSEAPTWRRVRRLEEEGYLVGTHALVDRAKLGYGVTAFVSVRFSTHDVTLAEGFAAKIRELPSVLSCHNVTGDVDYVLVVVTRDLAEYQKFTLVLRAIPGIVSIQTHLSLEEIKSTHVIEP